MTSFIALNVEIEEESEDEVDDSAEIQIEEALKLYQNAIKLHSQGPGYYPEAEAAYDELFRSEIFAWEKVLSDAQGAGRYNDTADSDDELEESWTPLLTASTTAVDGTPSSLPQILYLAYKNHGQFLLDRLKDQLCRIELEVQNGSTVATPNTVFEITSASLKLLVEALDRDDSDLELWRLVSRIAGFLGSYRIARYCLEAVLDNDEEIYDAWNEPLGLEVGFAKEQLKPLLKLLDDRVSQSQVSNIFAKHKRIVSSFRKRIDPCPYLPTLSPSLSGAKVKDPAKRVIVNVPVFSWASCGKAIRLQFDQEEQGISSRDPGATYVLAFPPNDADGMPAPPSKEWNTGIEPSAVRKVPLVNGQDPVDDVSRATNEGNNANTIDLSLGPSNSSPRDPNQEITDVVSQSPIKFDSSGFGETAGAAEVGDASVQLDPAAPGAVLTMPVSLPTRKRSSEMAELNDATDIGRSRSKRIKAKGSLDPDSLKDSTAEDWAKWYEQQLQIYHQADDLAFDLVGKVLVKLESKFSISMHKLREVVSYQPSGDGPDHEKDLVHTTDLVGQDLKSTLDGWDIVRSKAFLNGHDPKDPAGGIGGSGSPGFAAFLESSNQDSGKSSSFQDMPENALIEFISHIEDQEWMSLDQLAYVWLDRLLSVQDHEIQSMYEIYQWSDTLKASVVQMLAYQDQAIYTEINRLIADIEQRSSSERCTHRLLHLNEDSFQVTDHDEAKRKYTHLAQNIFELHLDVYGVITKPSSEVDEATRLLQRDRLSRWAALASKLNNQWPWKGDRIGEWLKYTDNLDIRYVWATVVCISLLEPAARDNSILCYQDLIQILKVFASKRQSCSTITIKLPNNAIMPEISVEAAQKEISRLTTMDFFVGVFDPENTDPLAVIESLEPLLELSVVDRRQSVDQDQRSPPGDNVVPAIQGTAGPPTIQTSTSLDMVQSNPNLMAALEFLKQGSLPLKLYLWQKLRDAYRAIGYPPQVLSCDLRMMSLIVDHLSSRSHAESAPESRRDGLLRWLHRLDDHVTRVLSVVVSKTEACDCLDADHVRTSLEALTSLQKLLHIFAMWEDTIRVGKTPPPAQANQQATRGLAKSTDKFRDMIVKTWTLQYALLKESMVQNENLFEAPSQDLIQHLEHVHHALGLRCYCSLANKAFLKMMKKESETFKLTEGLDIDTSQLIYDLYGVKVSPNAMEMQDHGCLTERLDKSTALEILDLVMTHVKRISMRDLLKSELKFTVDKMQQVIMIPKAANSPARTLNLRLVNNFLKSPLNPHDLYRSIQGIGGLCGSPAYDEGSDVAAKGWYSLLGQITLAKFRSLKRSSASSTDDLSVARAFLKHDLEFNTERWETWYTLAQVYDALIEEDATWTGDKLDNHMDDLAELQRKAIHCYSMAIAMATQYAEGSFEDTSKIADLCAEFGTRVYASTREPFSMKAFSLDGYKRHYNSRAAGMYQDIPFRSMQLYQAWRFASILLRRASVQKPQNWVISYTYGKVLWKMHNCDDDIRGSAKRISYQRVIDAITRAIEACPEKRDSKHADKDPILEPHYKLLAVVHKLVRSKRMSPEEGCRILKGTPYARNVSDIQGVEEWNGHVWQILKALRAADKANWHHRMVARAAHIMYDDDPSDGRSAAGARNELSQQIFTKTMAIQVWKPDHERPGRHFVYTGRYVRFFTRLLYQLNDKTSLEALARKIRKRAGDFVSHGSVWEEVCQAYLKLLRYPQPHCTIASGYSEVIFRSLDPQLFQSHAARLEAYAHSQQPSPPLLDILREAIELKKLNNNLSRPVNPFEDLIRDVYAHLYSMIIPGLIRNEAAAENRVRMRVDNILSNPSPSMVETSPPDGAGVQDEEQPKKTGARYITQKEIIRKAEAIAANPAPTVPAKVLKPLAPAPSMDSGVEIGVRPTSDAPRVAVVINTDVTNDANSSVPGSVHDSADDESELSDVDDEVADAELEAGAVVPERSPMFPNLRAGSADDPEETEDIEQDANDEQVEEPEADEGDEAELEDEAQEAPAKESGVHEGNW